MNTHTPVAPGDRAPAQRTGRRTTPRDGEIGDRLRLVRELAKVTQSSLGKAIGVTFQQIQKYETGRNRMAVSRLVAAADVLNCDFLWLATGETTPGNPQTQTLSSLLEAAGEDPRILHAAQALAGFKPDQRDQVLLIVKTIEAVNAKHAERRPPDLRELRPVRTNPTHL
ncbi:helix-turn-helix domain-containing protein [Marinicauda sp. Alg238-R41]|uniref:helix-turn-helix domain-containing protein n=1 Tax=Marinicauda sp. Alg238-R41 TaxID=2993447 RepID=UPI0022E7F500|nr:helix-turn-helix transcriptional regulator [Marinicauda sp. Alg238-R41]